MTLNAKLLLADVLSPRDPPAALALVEDVASDARRRLPDTAEQLIQGLQIRSFALAKLNQSEASYSALRESIQLGEKYFGPLDERTIAGLELLANTYHRFGNGRDELVTATDAVERARRAFGARRPHVLLLKSERTYADALRSDNRPAEAATILRGVLADQQKLDAGETMRVRTAMLRLGIALQLSGHLDEAIPLIRQAVALEQAQNPADSEDRLAYAEALANVLASAELTDEWKVQEDRVARLLGTRPSPHQTEVTRRLRRASLAVLLGRSPEARTLTAEAASMATAHEERLRVIAELIAARDARMQQRLSEALEQVDRTVKTHSLEALPLSVQSDVAAELGTLRLEMGDAPGAKPEIDRCRELLIRGQIAPSIPVTPAWSVMRDCSCKEDGSPRPRRSCCLSRRRGKRSIARVRAAGRFSTGWRVPSTAWGRKPRPGATPSSRGRSSAGRTCRSSGGSCLSDGRPGSAEAADGPGGGARRWAEPGLAEYSGSAAPSTRPPSGENPGALRPPTRLLPARCPRRHSPDGP